MRLETSCEALCPGLRQVFDLSSPLSWLHMKIGLWCSALRSFRRCACRIRGYGGRTRWASRALSI